MSKNNHQGFTLLELIVAVSILALIAVFSWRGLDAVLHTRDSLNLAQTQIDELQRGFNRLEHDALLTDDVPSLREGRLLLQAGNGTLVEYQLQNERLARRVLNVDGSVIEQQNLLSAIKMARLEVYRRASDGTALWTAQIDPPQPQPASQPASSPASAATVATPAAGATAPASPAVPAAPLTAGSANSSNFANPSALAGPTQPAVTGLRITIQLQQGAVIQRIFLLGAAA
jgi:general secretion pathway protein J